MGYRRHSTGRDVTVLTVVAKIISDALPALTLVYKQFFEQLTPGL